MIYAVLKLSTFIAIAFLVFVMGLVVAAIGYADPHSTPRAELSKLAGYVERAERWWSAPRF